MQCPLLWHHRLYHRLPLTANSGRYADMPNLAAALVADTILACPVLLMRSYPPTLTQCWGSFLRQLRPLPCWCKQPHLVAQWCRHLQPSRQHPLLPPSYPLPLVARYFYLQGEGPPIHSVLVIHHYRNTHDSSTNLVVLANVMAPELPIHWSTFFVGGNIGPAHLTNLLQKDGLKQWRGNSLAYALEILLLPGSF
jgi:hypothetical protein